MFHLPGRPAMGLSHKRGMLMTVTQMPRAAAHDRCRTCSVSHLGFCSWFGADDTPWIVARASQTRFAAGTPILIQGQPANRVGIILSGLVKIVLNDEDGEEHLIQLLHSGAIVGDPFASECAFSWEAATETELCWMSPTTLATAIRACPAAYRCQLDATMRLVKEQRFAQVAMRGRNALQRLAHWLFLQSPAELAPAPVRLRIVLTRRDLASLLEMTVETLCRVLHQLEERGAILLAAPDLVELRDRTKLKQLGRGQDERLQETLLADGWEWGARTVGPRALAPAKPELKASEPAPFDLGQRRAARVVT